jgi:hypothetical protein
MNKIDKIIIFSLSIIFTGIFVPPVVYSAMQNDNYQLSKFLYSSTPPILPDNATENICDFWGNNCSWQSVTMDDRLSHFNNWCYSIMNTYHSGKTSQTFRTVSIDCFNYVLDQKLEPLNAKIDNLTAQIKLLNDKLGK